MVCASHAVRLKNTGRTPQDLHTGKAHCDTREQPSTAAANRPRERDHSVATGIDPVRALINTVRSVCLSNECVHKVASLRHAVRSTSESAAKSSRAALFINTGSSVCSSKGCAHKMVLYHLALGKCERLEPTEMISPLVQVSLQATRSRQHSKAAPTCSCSRFNDAVCELK